MNPVPLYKKSNTKFLYKKNFSNLPRKNKQIRAREVRVIGVDGKQVGVLSVQEALTLAQNCGLDLVEISPKAQPPVCKILDFGKYMYEESKKNKSQKATATKLKEIKLGVSIELNDYQTKLRQAENFLFKGNKVKLYINLKGRQMGNPQIGIEVVERMVEDLKQIGTADAAVVRSGRNIFVLMTPLPTAKRTLIHNRKDEIAGTQTGPHE
ncbi:MAG: translation initiation factor IF-3 [Puniceicoccales bacterium]|jgi:translation initiation factor IF-3|nr:translation initiation factor IF-3 [Puniceicoccales bacterium]